jgi:hypothetical protein
MPHVGRRGRTKRRLHGRRMQGMENRFGGFLSRRAGTRPINLRNRIAICQIIDDRPCRFGGIQNNTIRLGDRPNNGISSSAFSVIFHHPFEPGFLKAIPRSLRPGGHYFILECYYTPDQIPLKRTGGPPVPEWMMYSKQILSEALDDERLETIKSEELVRDVVEGLYPQWKSRCRTVRWEKEVRLD